MNTFIRQEIVQLFQMPCLAKSYDSSVVSYLTWKLEVTFFFNHPVHCVLPHVCILSPTAALFRGVVQKRAIPLHCNLNDPNEATTPELS